MLRKLSLGTDVGRGECGKSGSRLGQRDAAQRRKVNRQQSGFVIPFGNVYQPISAQINNLSRIDTGNGGLRRGSKVRLQAGKQGWIMKGVQDALSEVGR